MRDEDLAGSVLGRGYVEPSGLSPIKSLTVSLINALTDGFGFDSS